MIEREIQVRWCGQPRQIYIQWVFYLKVYITVLHGFIPSGNRCTQYLLQRVPRMIRKIILLTGDESSARKCEAREVTLAEIAEVSGENLR